MCWGVEKCVGRCEKVRGAHALLYTSPHISSHTPRTHPTPLPTLTQHLFPYLSDSSRYTSSHSPLPTLSHTSHLSPHSPDTSPHTHLTLSYTSLNISPHSLSSFSPTLPTTLPHTTPYLLYHLPLTKISHFSHLLPN